MQGKGSVGYARRAWKRILPGRQKGVSLADTPSFDCNII